MSYSFNVSIIIPVFNKFDYTYKCLSSIYQNTDLTNVEIIVADDCSTDNTVNLSKYFSNVKIIRNARQMGFLKNCNNAAKYINSKYILFLNNDTEVYKGWLKYLLDIAEKDDKVAIVGSKMIFPNGRLQEAGGIIWKDGRGHNYGRNDDPSKAEYNYVKEVDYCSGASILVRKSFWDEVGGFDENFAPAYYEDTDLAFKAREKGYKVLYQPLSIVLHYESVSNQPTGMKKFLDINRHKFYAKWKHVLENEHFDYFKDIFLARDRSRNKVHILILINEYIDDITDVIKNVISPHTQVTVVDLKNVLSSSELVELQQSGVEVRDNFDYASNIVYIDSIVLFGFPEEINLLENLILLKKRMRKLGKFLEIILLDELSKTSLNSYDRYIDKKIKIQNLNKDIFKRVKKKA